MSIHSKAVLISGAAQGIGRCMARTFLSKGHRVYILDINEKELDYTVNTHLKKFHPNIGSSICNLRDVGAIRKSVDDAAKFFGGKIDVLVNNGGIAHAYWKPANTTMAEPSTISQWQAYIETNLTAPFAVSQACIPYMKVAESNDEHVQVMASRDADGDFTAGPCIVHISSFRWQQSDPNQEGYASTKAGLFGLTQSMAVSCSRWGIRVNMVSPGRIKVSHECKDGDEKGLKWEHEEDDLDPHPTNRAGRPEDIASAVEFVADAGFMTGQDVTLDGGALRMKNKA